MLSDLEKLINQVVLIDYVIIILGENGMARNIYSFIKIEKRQTKRGIYASAFGIVSLICMAVLTIASFVKAGNLPAFVGGIGYLSFIAAAFGLWLSVQLRKDNEAYGTMVHGAFYINLASVVIHGLIFFAGCLSIIM